MENPTAEGQRIGTSRGGDTDAGGAVPASDRGEGAGWRVSVREHQRLVGEAVVRVRPRSIARVLSAVVVVVVVLGILSVLIRTGVLSDFPGDKTIGRQFDLDSEANTTSWLASIMLLLCGLSCLFLGLMYRGRGSSGRRWTALGAIFVVLSLDEVASIHETVNSTLRDAWGLSGPLRFAWVIPAAIVMVGVVAYFWRFVWRLPPRTSLLVLASGGIYLSGVLGVEMFNGIVFERFGPDSIQYGFGTAVEETLEFVGLAVFLVAAAIHIDTTIGSISISPVTEVDPADAPISPSVRS